MGSAHRATFLSPVTGYILGSAVLAVLLLYVGYPSLEMFIQGGVGDNWSRLFESSSSANVRALRNSVVLSVMSVIGAGVVGTALAYFIFRFDFPLRKFLTAIAVLPLALPPLVGVLAFLFLYGESGILPRSIQALVGSESVPFSFAGLWAVWLVHVYSMYVYFYLFVSSALARADRSIFDASHDLGGSNWHTFSRVVLPMLRSPILSASLLVFMISMASFTAPLLFAGSEPFLTLQIFNYKINGDLAMSATVSTLLTLICIAFLGLSELLQRGSGVSASKGASNPPQRHRSLKITYFGSAAAFLFSIFLVLPILTVILISFAVEGNWTSQILPTAYTVEHYTSLFTSASIAQPVWNSLTMSAIATAACLLVGVATAITLTKTRVVGRSIIRVLAILPFAIPGTVVAVNLILAFSSPSWISFGHALVGSFWILPLAYFVRNIPLIVRSSMSALDQYDDSLTEASMDLGASSWRTFRSIILPAITPGILAGMLLTFVACVGEFVSSIMLYIYDNRPISMEIWSQLRLYDFGAASAYSVLLMVIILTSTMVLRMLGNRGRFGAAF